MTPNLGILKVFTRPRARPRLHFYGRFSGPRAGAGADSPRAAAPVHSKRTVAPGRPQHPSEYPCAQPPCITSPKPTQGRESEALASPSALLSSRATANWSATEIFCAWKESHVRATCAPTK